MTVIDPIGAAGAGVSTSSAPSSVVDNPGAELGRDAFLKLLVAQLKYQDPTNPADTSQMMSQTAELTMVDRLNQLAASFDANAATQRLSLAGTIVGKDITFVDAEGVQRSARVETAKTDVDGLTFVAGGYSVPFAAIVSVDAPPTIPPASPSFSPTNPSNAVTAPTGTASVSTATETATDPTADPAVEADTVAANPAAPPG